MSVNQRLYLCGNRGGCWLQNLFTLLALLTACVGTRGMKSPASEFSSHSVIQPSLHHARTKRELTTTRDTNGGHHSEVQVRVPVEGEEWVLELRLNENLVAGGHTLQYQQGGKTVQHTPKKEELDLCHYSGSVRGKPQSWVAVSTCHGVRGVIFDGQKMRYIEPAQGAEIQSLHYLYDHKDLTSQQIQSSLGGQSGMLHDIGDVTNNTHDIISNRRTPHDKKNRTNRYKRGARSSELREPYNAQESSRYVELVLVADHQEFRAHGRDLRAVHHKFLQLVNIVYSMYAPLNIYIALVRVEVWNETDRVRITSNDELLTLKEFAAYRQKLIHDIPHDTTHLITHQKFDSGRVGLASISTMCLGNSVAVISNYTEVIGLNAATVAHEMGHTFGITHDDIQNCPVIDCQDRKCIMAATATDVVPVHWSSCSLRALKRSFEEGLDYCLHNKPKHLFESPTCGNGFIEPGEQCDCGVTAGGGPNPCHACCHHDTCMLRSNATCGAGACCDLTTCRPKSAGVTCRGAERECDLPEYCTGHSEYCPPDVFKMDSTPCGDGGDQAYCVRGSCRSHSGQCRALWGAGATSHQECYSLKNTGTTKQGNCGSDSSGNLKACASSNVLCGLLQCNVHENSLAHAMGRNVAADRYITSYVRNGLRLDCYTAMVNLGGDNVELGMVPDGAKCGHEKMCLNQTCMPVKAVQEEIARRGSSVCPSDCSGHGVCNSEGHCHCDAGYAPPLCSTPGPGGSDDSGPATALNSAQRNFMIAMYVIFLGIIPLIALLIFLVYYSRHKELWHQNLYDNYITCCAKNNSKLSNKIKTRSNVDSVNQEDIKNNISNNSTKSPESKHKNITKNDIQIVNNINNYKNVSSKEPFYINNMTAKQPVNEVKQENTATHININDTSHTHVLNDDFTLKPTKPMSDISGNLEDGINNVKLKYVQPKVAYKDSDIKTGRNEVKLLTENILSNSKKDELEIAINNVKLKPVKPKTNTAHCNIKAPTNVVSFKPAMPLSSSKPKPLIRPKPDWLNPR